MAEPDLSQYDPVFQAAGTEWNVDPTLLKAVAAQESGGRTNAVSPKNAHGLMQITPDTQKYLGVTDPNDPVQSIYGAAKYLSEGLDKEGSPEGALLYYHGGPGWRQAYGPESRAYVPGVTAHYVALKPPDQAQDAPASSTGPLIVGDSIASKGGLGGSGVIGASPKAVLDNVSGLPGDQVNGRDVVLSSGASNNPAQAGLLEQQIKALQDKGARSVTVVGVGDAPKLQGVNDGLAATAGRFGANFVPLDTTQLSPDRVHPTQQGYRTLLAAATPKVATDATPTATPAPAGSQGQGKAMASDDLPSWLPPAPKAGGDGASSAPAAAATTGSDSLPSWLPPAPQPSTATKTQQIDFANRPPGQQPDASELGLSLPQSGNGPGASGPSLDERVRNALAPSPDTVYGDVLPLAMDEKTGTMRLALPNMIRAPLLGLTGGVGANALTIDPATNAVRLTPEASSVSTFAATPLRFSGANPLVATGPAAIDLRGSQLNRPVTLGELTGAIERATPPETTPVPSTGAPETPPAQTAPPPAAAPSGAWVPAEVGRTYPENWQTRVNRDTGRPEVLDPTRGTPGPSVQSGASAPQPVGAEATTAPIPAKTEAQRVRDLTSDVQQTAEDRAGPQMVDNNAYVQGIPPRPLAAREFNAQNSLDHKVAYEGDTAYRSRVDATNKERNEGMVDLLRSDAQDAIALDQAHETRSQVSPAELGVFENEQPTSVEAISAKIDRLLAGPEGKQRAVRNTLSDVKDSLTDTDGNLETMPSQIYGARKNLTDLLKRGAKGMGDVADDVRASKGVLEGLLPDFDAAITAGAPKFQDYLKQWSDLSKPIDQMDFLQQYQTGSKKITDKDGYLIPNKVQKMLDDILQGNKARGVNKAKSLTDEQIQNVVNVRNELAAQQLQDRLAGVRGSDTFQKFNRAGVLGEGPVGTAVRGAAEAAIHSGLAATTGGVGNALYQWGVKPAFAARSARRIARQTAARKEQLLAPPPSNPLNSP